MTARYDPDRHRRHSLRLKDYDHASAGAYFITIVTRDRACLFAHVNDGGIELNDAGNMVAQAWNDLPSRFAHVVVDAFVVMPNHVHGIIVLTEKNRCATVGAPLVGALNPTGLPNSRAPTRGAPTPGQARAVADGPRLAVGSVVGAYKSLTTVEFARGVKTLGWPPFGGKLWQRNFYEHVIRDDTSLNGIREYIANNPAAWAEDPENPAVQSGRGG